MGETVKLQLGETPSAEVVKAAQAAFDVVDARDRTLTLKKPGVLAQYRLIEALGDSAKNEVYMNMVLPLIYVSAIDGTPVVQPNSKREVEALITRLDEEGIAAVMAGVAEHFGAPNPEKDKAAVKN